MKHRLLLIFFSFILLLQACTNPGVNPRAVKGVMDLSSWSLNEKGPVKLNGEWEFYWKVLSRPEEPLTDSSEKKSYIKVPASWKGHNINDEKLPRFGYASYRLVVKNAENGSLLLYFTVPNAASRFWINGKPAAVYGNVSEQSSGEKGSIGKKIIEFSNDKNEIEIIIQVSNFNKFGSGITYPVVLGKKQDIYSSKLTATSADVFIFAILLIISFYHFSKFIYRRKDKASLLFSIFSLIYAVRSVTINEIILTKFIPSLDWQLVFRADFLSIALIVPLFVKYISYLYSEQMIRQFNKFFYGAGLLYALIIVIFPPCIFSSFLVYYHIIILLAGFYLLYVFTRAMLKDQQGALMSIVGFLIVFITGSIDILIANEIINMFFISSFGILGFFLTQTLNLSSRFSKAYEQIEQFSVILEKEVSLRTLELQDERNLLKESNENFQKELNLAKRIQKKFIPQSSPVDYISFLYKPMEEVGGDFLEFIHFRDSDKIGIFISDVSGHGVPAAFITSMIKTGLLQSGVLREDPAGLLLYLNNMLLSYTDDNFVTAMYCIYDPADKKLLYSLAGHNPPFVISDNDITTLNPGKSIPLAIMNRSNLEKYNKLFINNEITLADCKKLILYTDGLTETVPIDSELCFFEYNGLIEYLRGSINLPCPQFINDLHQSLLKFRKSDQFDDDICIVCVDL